MIRYRLNHPVVGVERAATGMHIPQLATGDIITIPDTDQENGLVEIVCQGRNVAVFIQDLWQRAERIDVKTVARISSRPGKREAC